MTREENPAHQRSWLVRLTPHGQRSTRRVLARERIVVDAVATRIAAADMEAALRVAEAILEGFRSEAKPPARGAGEVR